MSQRPENQQAGKEYKPRPATQGPCPAKSKPRPNAWKSGPNPMHHEQYQTWLVHKAQARFRGEDHELTFEQYRDAWCQHDYWQRRGRRSDSICMTRVDAKQSWNVNNIVMETRGDYIARMNKSKIGTTYRKRNK